MSCLWRKTASPGKPVERRYHPTLSPLLPSPTAPSLEAVRDARNKREREGRTSGREGWSWCLPCVVWDLSPRRERLSKGLKPVEEWAVCRWKRSVFQGNQREGKCSLPGRGMGISQNSPGCHVVPHLRGEGGEWVSFSQTFLFFTPPPSTSR